MVPLNPPPVAPVYPVASEVSTFAPVRVPATTPRRATGAVGHLSLCPASVRLTLSLQAGVGSTLRIAATGIRVCRMLRENPFLRAVNLVRAVLGPIVVRRRGA